MKKKTTLLTPVIFLTISLSLALAQTGDSNKFERYRSAIKKEYGIDISNFKGSLHGGKADGKEVTKYDLRQLLVGIKVEQEHVRDKMTALEISMDHLEEFPDYYTRLEKLEKEAEEEQEREARKGKR